MKKMAKRAKASCTIKDKIVKMEKGTSSQSTGKGFTLTPNWGSLLLFYRPCYIYKNKLK